MSWSRVVEAPFQLGESPFWHPDEQSLYWVDIPGCAILRANVFMGTCEVWPMAQQPGCMAPVQGGGLVIALRDGIYRANDWGDHLQRICAAPYDSQQLRFNDGKADPLGRFWAGSYCDKATSPDGALYCLETDPQDDKPDAQPGRAAGLRLVEKTRPARVSNGLAFSPDHKTLYWSDTAQGKIFAFDWIAASNHLQNQRVFKQFDAKPAGWTYGTPGYQNYQGRPDGATVDVEGNYYVAMFEGAAVLKLSPRGELLQKIPLPAMCPTMPCLGGDDLKTLYVTTATIGRSSQELADLPWSGCTLALRVDVPGLPVNFINPQGFEGHTV